VFQRIRGFFYENALYKFTFDIDIDIDGQTDGRAIAYTRYGIYAVARKNEE